MKKTDTVHVGLVQVLKCTSQSWWYWVGELIQLELIPEAAPSLLMLKIVVALWEGVGHGDGQVEVKLS